MKAITIMGMSGVGKTTLANKLNKSNWFHYSADYRIASHYLKKDIQLFLKEEASKSSVIKYLLEKDSVKIKQKLSINNLLPVSTYIGKVGNPKLSGIDLETFMSRQGNHYQAEMNSTYDIGKFKKIANESGFKYFLHDSGGSICELYRNNEVIEYLAQQTKIVYIHAEESLSEEITKRAIEYPKPLYYDKDFLLKQLNIYKESYGKSIIEMNPNDFIRFIIPKLIKHREKLYLNIANKYGIVINANDILSLRDEKDFIEILNKT